jgi:hypothetical protein
MRINNFRTDRKKYYDIEARIATGGSSSKNATISLLAFITKLLKPARIIDTVFTARLEQIKSDIDKQYIIDKSYVNNVNEWRSLYKVVVPLYSLEVLTYLSDDIALRVDTDYKVKRIGAEASLVKILFESILEILNLMLQENPYLLDSNIIKSFKTSLIVESITDNHLEEFFKENLQDDITSKKVLNAMQVESLSYLESTINELQKLTTRKSNDNLRKDFSTFIDHVRKVDSSNSSIVEMVRENINLTDEKLQNTDYKRESLQRIKILTKKSLDELKSKFNGE